VPLLSAKNITAIGTIDYDSEDSRISEREFASLQRAVPILSGDLLLTVVGSLGRRAIYRGQRVAFQRSVAYVRPDPNLASGAFLFHAMGSPRFQTQLLRLSNATAQAGVYLSALASTSVPLPTLPEQRRIAEILDTLDDAIRATGQVIAKLERLRQGLLHDLLTRGIDETGEVRDPNRRTDEFAESASGRIPRTWVLSRLGPLVSILCGGAFSSRYFDPDNGIPLVRIRDIGRTVTEVKYCGPFEERYVLRDQDILIGMDGDFLVTRWGGGRALLNQRVCKLEPCTAGLSRDYLFAVLQPEIDAIHRTTPETTVRHLSTKRIEAIELRLPPRPEQDAIAEVIASVDGRIRGERDEHTKLCMLRQGLADDLLTGRVRVNVAGGATP